MEVVVAPPPSKVEPKQQEVGGKYFDYSQRAQWLRAVVLGGNEGLVSTALMLVIGVGVFEHEAKALIITGLVGLVAGAFSIATAEFVSAYTQVNIMNCQTKREVRRGSGEAIGRWAVPILAQIAVAASVAYVAGGVVPLLAAAFIRRHKIRFLVLVISACLSMLVLGCFGATLGNSPIARSCARVLAGGCIEIMIMLGKRKVLDCFGL